MNFFKSLFCTAEKQLANDLVDRLVKDLPPKFMREGSTTLSVNKVTRSLERAFQTASEFRGKKNWGVYRRSVVANTFKWRLKESGYSEKFVDLATEGLIVELSKKVGDKSGVAH